MTQNYLSGLAAALSGNSSEIRKSAAWATTRPINGFLAHLYPTDAAFDELGNVICFSKHGDHNSQYGWDIDHRQPRAIGGSDTVDNLRALRCAASFALGLRAYRTTEPSEGVSVDQARRFGRLLMMGSTAMLLFLVAIIVRGDLKVVT